MALNIQNRRQSDVIVTATTLSGAITGAPGAYGFSPLQAAAYADLLTAANAKATAFDGAKAAYLTASQEKKAAFNVLIENTSAFANVIYSHPGITDALITAAGLPLPKKPAVRLPKTPLNVVANPQADGDVNLTWKRNGNTRGVAFVVEQKLQSGDWTMVATTTAAKITLKGYTPGVPTWFRVIASNRGLLSTPSLDASIYAPTAAVELQIAA